MPGQQQAEAELQQDSQITPSEQETITQTIPHLPPGPYQAGRCQEGPREGALQTQVPGQLCEAEKFIPHQKEGRKKLRLKPHSILQPRPSVFGSHLQREVGMQVTELGCSSGSARGGLAAAGSPLTCRCGCSVWAALPLHSLQVLPGIRRGRAGTVSACPGLWAPQTNPGRLAAGCSHCLRLPPHGWD